ncbi:Acyl-coenzyme A synthetase ACSM4 [uncultured delta proteobacterium]|uniref:Acyl-coenzyme A synthetase ACSM4 n=1 Tax=uncultured delta proteobacterium TaxID=34034 RepID=A0A212K7L1_9DELT|nr:Acyl-coenzyme A synthetase ACSM4 [uncultured delta proteobacterium]
MLFTDKLRSATHEELCRDFSIAVMPDFNFAFDVVDRKAFLTPDAVCVRHIDDSFARRDFTYKDMARASSKMANALKGLGLKKGDKVLLMLHRRIEWWQAMLGLHKLGAVAIPSPAQLTPHDIAFRCRKSRAKAIITDYRISGGVESVRESLPDLCFCIQAGPEQAGETAALPSALPSEGWLDLAALLEDASPAFPRPLSDEELACGKDPLLIFFSSGTTGMPKMVLHNHEYPLGHYFTAAYWHNVEPGDLHMAVADTGWAKAAWGKFYGQWMAGATSLIYDFRGKFCPANLLRVITGERVNSFCAPPTVYRHLIQEDLAQYDFSHLRHCAAAGEPLNESVIHDWKQATGLNIHEGFGQSETALMIASLPCMEFRAGSIGKPVPGWDVALLDDNGEICPAGEEGEICVRIAEKRPHGIFTGYLDESGQIISARRGDWYHTGDKARTDEDGYYWFLGRVDDLIKTSGYRVGPFEVESALVSHPAVLEAAVTGVPDAVRGQAIKASVVLTKDYAPSRELVQEIQEYVKSITAPYKYPRIVEFVKELPKTFSGKIKRAEIRERDLKTA